MSTPTLPIAQEFTGPALLFTMAESARGKTVKRRKSTIEVGMQPAHS